MTLIRSLCLGAVALSTLSAAPRVHTKFAWPWFILVRGGGLLAPVTIGGRATGMHSDIIVVYESLRSDPGPPADFATRRSYEVAEFWGPEWKPLPNGKPPADLHFEGGATFAKIYSGTARTPPVWVGRAQGVDGVARTIGAEGEKILTAAGLKLR